MQPVYTGMTLTKLHSGLESFFAFVEEQTIVPCTNVFDTCRGYSSGYVVGENDRWL